jgi:hypothetical protein
VENVRGKGEGLRWQDPRSYTKARHTHGTGACIRLGEYTKFPLTH